jgi:hypothetical protein
VEKPVVVMILAKETAVALVKEMDLVTVRALGQAQVLEKATETGKEKDLGLEKALEMATVAVVEVYALVAVVC